VPSDRKQAGKHFQSFNLIGELTVYENVNLPLTYRKMPLKELRERVNQAFGATSRFPPAREPAFSVAAIRVVDP